MAAPKTVCGHLLDLVQREIELAEQAADQPEALRHFGAASAFDTATQIVDLNASANLNASTINFACSDADTERRFKLQGRYIDVRRRLEQG